MISSKQSKKSSKHEISENIYELEKIRVLKLWEMLKDYS